MPKNVISHAVPGAFTAGSLTRPERPLRWRYTPVFINPNMDRNRVVYATPSRKPHAREKTSLQYLKPKHVE